MKKNNETKKKGKRPFRLAVSLTLALLLAALVPIGLIYLDHTQTYAATSVSTEDAASTTGLRTDDNGALVSGWLHENGAWFYFEDGNMVTNAWRLDETQDFEAWRYLGADGQALTTETQAWIAGPRGIWAWISFNEDAHALDQARSILNEESYFLFC